jgi:hypothetical protein
MPHVSIKRVLKSISTIYLITFLSFATYVVISTIFVSKIGTLIQPDRQDIYTITTVLILILIGHAPISYLWPEKLIRNIDPALTLPGKLVAYRTAMFIRYMTMNSAGLLISITYMATGNANQMYLQAIVLLFFLMYKPSPIKIAADLDLNEGDKQKIITLW